VGGNVGNGNGVGVGWDLRVRFTDGGLTDGVTTGDASAAATGVLGGSGALRLDDREGPVVSFGFVNGDAVDDTFNATTVII